MYKVSNYIEWNFLPRSDYKLLNGKMKKKKIAVWGGSS